jgi:hypothetical protein
MASGMPRAGSAGAGATAASEGVVTVVVVTVVVVVAGGDAGGGVDALRGFGSGATGISVTGGTGGCGWAAQTAVANTSVVATQ